MKRTTKNFAEVIQRELAADPDLAAAVEQERFNANVASEIYNARNEAGLTQKGLARQLGTHQSAIARLENADYDGHSLKMLERIAQALGKRVEIRFVNQSIKAQSPGRAATNAKTSVNRKARKAHSGG